MFVAVVEAGGFTGAAKRVGVSAGQASKLIARLEADLGVQLLKRTTRAVTTTEAGRNYYERVKALLEEFEVLDASVRAQSGAPAGRVRLTAPETFGVAQLTPILIGFAAAYPDIRLDVGLTDRRVSLVDEGYDLAVRIGVPADSRLMARKLCEARILTVASADYTARAGKPEKPEDLGRHACIIDTNFSEPRLWPYRDGDRRVAAPVDGPLSFSNAGACLRAAEAGLGVARLPSFVAGPAVREGRLGVLLARYEPPPMEVHVLYPPGRALAAKVRVLIDYMAQSLEGKPPWDQGW